MPDIIKSISGLYLILLGISILSFYLIYLLVLNPTNPSFISSLVLSLTAIAIFTQTLVIVKKERTAIFDEIYYPVLRELKKVRDDVLSFRFFRELKEWNKITESNSYFKIKKKLRNKLYDFFQITLQNYNVHLGACFNEVRKVAMRELIKHFKMVDGFSQKNSKGTCNDDEFANPFLDDVTYLVLAKSKTGGTYGTERTSMSMVNASRNFDILRKHFYEKHKVSKLKFENFDDFVFYIYNLTKNHPLLKDSEEKMKEMIGKTDEIINMIEKYVNL